ncbi:hypothetical protein [Actinomadura flavalba]|uniref:hypothetical protein n=1 Tax=Actinomadura flavalba TaxID=1120938 RepID=UPI0003797535|nr:hypothetical protein [Actinomadura flavalba]
MNGIAAAFGATALYYLGFAVFKIAADRMEPLRGNRIVHMAWTILSNWVFLVALAMVLMGLSLQIVALTTLSLGVAVPIFMSGVVPLLLIAMIFFGDRLTAREWLSLLLIGAAILLLVASTGNAPAPEGADVPLWKLAVVVLPAVLVPLALMVFGDHRPDGRHARPVTGIAYGLISGFPVGTSELAIKGWSDADAPGLAILTTPFPYVTVLAAALGFGILVTAFQRCRVSVVAAVMTVSAKSYLLLMGTFMYAEPWPTDQRNAALRVLALVLGLAAVLQFPRHRPATELDLPHAPEPPLSRDPFGEPPLSRPTTGVSRLEYGLASAPTPFDVPPAEPDRRYPRQPPGGYPSGQYPSEQYPSQQHPSGQYPSGSADPLNPGPLGRDPLGRGPYGPGDEAGRPEHEHERRDRP